MIPLQFKRLWVVIGYGMVIGVVALSLLPITTRPLGFSWEDKLHHIFAYGTLMLWFAQLHPKSYYGWLAGAFIVQGILVEALQSQLGTRIWDEWDIAANSVGTVVCWGLALGGMNTLLHRFEIRCLQQGKNIES